MTETIIIQLIDNNGSKQTTGSRRPWIPVSGGKETKQLTQPPFLKYIDSKLIGTNRRRVREPPPVERVEFELHDD
ncbi:hypothetical protein EUGRSUZ_F04054 [Eucalyptus grandis]|uniref:Uncharacterized protein n=2 Tax=Eucalyptus grandis TaxID=71139 RepID=A0ACC3KP54_EUCGR|nr:hypothetical protein EUGRSUZ_F04054 [Eucalyptus grandis]